MHQWAWAKRAAAILAIIGLAVIVDGPQGSPSLAQPAATHAETVVWHGRRLTNSIAMAGKSWNEVELAKQARALRSGLDVDTFVDPGGNRTDKSFDVEMLAL